MTARNPNSQSGDVILDRYMPLATSQEREAARENLRAFAMVVVGIARRLALEEREQAIGAKGHCTVDLMERQPPQL